MNKMTGERVLGAFAVVLSILYIALIIILTGVILLFAIISVTYLVKIPAEEVLPIVNKMFRFDALSEKEHIAAFYMSHLVLLLLSFVLLARPEITAIIQALASPKAAISFEKVSSRVDVREYAAELLATEYEKAEQIKVISGDYSWLSTSENGQRAAKALAKKIGEGKVLLLSYRTREHVTHALQGLDHKHRQVLVDAITYNAQFYDLKMSVISILDYRTCIFLATGDEGANERLVRIKDKDAGRRLINLIERIFDVGAGT